MSSQRSTRSTRSSSMSASENPDRMNILILLGATGDLAKKKIYPQLWEGFEADRMPQNLHIIGYGRSKNSSEALMQRVREWTDVSKEEVFKNFGRINHYVRGSYDDASLTVDLKNLLHKLKGSLDASEKANAMHLVFYLALPPSVYEKVTTLISDNIAKWIGCQTPSIVVAIEKPFGRDTDTCKKLEVHLEAKFAPRQIRKIDH